MRPVHHTYRRAPARALALLLVLALVPAISAQDRPGPRVARALVNLRPTTTVRLHVPSSGRLEGRLVSASPDSVVLLTSEGQRRSLAAVAVDSVWVRRGRAGRGALIGGGVGTVLGLAFGMSVKDVCENCGSVAPLTALVGAAGGVLLGALVGSAFHGYDRRAP